MSRADDRTRVQLALIDEVATVLGEAGIRFWLAGGWAIDFLAGKPLQAHADLDFVAWELDADRLATALVRRDFQASESPRPAEIRRFAKSEERLSFALLVRDDHGTLLTAGGRWDDWAWPGDALEAPPGRVGNVVCPIVSLAAQLDNKASMAAHPHGEPPREQDLADIERLQAMAHRAGLEL